MLARSLSLVGLLTLATAGVASAAPLFSDNFNGYTGVSGPGTTELDDAYNVDSSFANVSLSSGGLGGSQALRFFNDSNLTSKTAVDFAGNLASGVVVSAYFQFRDSTSSGQGNPVIGLAPSSTDVPLAGAAVRLNISGAIATSIGGSVNTGSTLSLVDDNWYYLVGTFTTPGVNQITVKAELFNATSAGVVGTSVGSHTFTYTNASIFADTSMYPGVRVSGRTLAEAPNGIRADNVDNLVVSLVPEPASLGLVAALGAIGLRRRGR